MFDIKSCLSPSLSLQQKGIIQDQECVLHSKLLYSLYCLLTIRSPALNISCSQSLFYSYTIMGQGERVPRMCTVIILHGPRVNEVAWQFRSGRLDICT
jgi:hypothetical protein